MKIFEALRQDHEKQRLLLKILAETGGNTAAAVNIFKSLRHSLKVMLLRRTPFLFSSFGERFDTVDLTRHGIAEHHEIDELLAKLDETDMSSPAWLRHLKTLAGKS